jgi:hypothetical protein
VSEGQRCGGESSVRHISRGGDKKPALKVPWQCALVLLVKVDTIECKTVGTEEGKAMGSVLHYEQGLY